MMSQLFSSIRPNPRYVPGGTENFWVSSISESSGNEKVAEVKDAERKSTVANGRQKQELKLTKNNWGFLNNIMELKFNN